MKFDLGSTGDCITFVSEYQVMVWSRYRNVWMRIKCDLDDLELISWIMFLHWCRLYLCPYGVLVFDSLPVECSISNVLPV